MADGVFDTHLPTIAYRSPASNSSSFSCTAFSRALRSLSESPLQTNPMNVASNPSAWKRCMICGSKSAVSDITIKCREEGSSAWARRARFAEPALVVRCNAGPCDETLGPMAPGSGATLLELVARRARRRMTLTIFAGLGIVLSSGCYCRVISIASRGIRIAFSWMTCDKT